MGLGSRAQGFLGIGFKISGVGSRIQVPGVGCRV